MEYITSILLKLFQYQYLRNKLDKISTDGSCDIFTPEMYIKVLICSFISLVASVLIGFFIYKKREYFRQFFCDFIDFIKSLFGECFVHLKQEKKTYLIVLFFILLIGTLSRAYYLFFSNMRYDESYSYVYLASQNIFKAVSQQDLSNNHFFNTVLMKISAAIFGNYPASLRLSAFVGGVLNIFLGYLIGRIFYSSLVGLVTASIISCMPFFIHYSWNAR
ncbi:MAG: hypothetical protein HQK51_14055 [Oligoflexia bacterium]|nr:hypothetical protein [Oligoflexia bacterium]